MEKDINIYLALGSNLGTREMHLQSAVAHLPPEVQVTAQSPVYQTKPWGYTKQPQFLNQVIEGKTALRPLQLLDHIKGIEKRMGRKPSFRYGPRIIDIDIILYNDLVFQSPSLEIPHPRMEDRDFVLVPLADIAPQVKHPVSGKTIHSLAKRWAKNI